jgi:hypothetical protein
MKQVSKQLLKKLSSVSSKQDKKGRQCRGGNWSQADG